MQIVFLAVGIFAITYGVYSFKKSKITVANHMVSIFSIFDWWKNPSVTLTGKTAKLVSVIFIFFGTLAVVNFLLITLNIVSYP